MEKSLLSRLHIANEKQRNRTLIGSEEGVEDPSQQRVHLNSEFVIQLSQFCKPVCNNQQDD